jgi:hypothetical protein
MLKRIVVVASAPLDAWTMKVTDGNTLCAIFGAALEQNPFQQCRFQLQQSWRGPVRVVFNRRRMRQGAP